MNSKPHYELNTTDIIKQMSRKVTARFVKDSKTKDDITHVKIGVVIDPKTGRLLRLGGFTLQMKRDHMPLEIDGLSKKPLKITYREMVHEYAYQMSVHPGLIRVYQNDKLFDYRQSEQLVCDFKGWIRFEVRHDAILLTITQLLWVEIALKAIRRKVLELTRVCHVCYKTGAKMRCQTCHLRRWCSFSCMYADAKHAGHCEWRIDSPRLRSSRRVICYHAHMSRSEWDDLNRRQEALDVIEFSEYLSSIFADYTIVIYTTDVNEFIIRYESRRLPPMGLIYQSETLDSLTRVINRCQRLHKVVGFEQLLHTLEGSGWLDDLMCQHYHSAADLKAVHKEVIDYKEKHERAVADVKSKSLTTTKCVVTTAVDNTKKNAEDDTKDEEEDYYKVEELHSDSDYDEDKHKDCKINSDSFVDIVD